MNQSDFIIIYHRQYQHKEIPELIGKTKWVLNRDLKPHRERLGARDGYRWNFEQVKMILSLYGIEYKIVYNENL